VFRDGFTNILLWGRQTAEFIYIKINILEQAVLGGGVTISNTLRRAA
jgi:hypothetical protein